MRQKNIIILTLIAIFLGIGYFLAPNVLKMYGCVEGGGTWSWVDLECSFEQKVQLDDKSIANNNLYPWPNAITDSAIAAIYRSVDNINSDKVRSDLNFPSNPNDFEFDLKKRAALAVIGYTQIKKDERIYSISFRPESEIEISGPFITVEINIETGQAIQVYMEADS